MSCGGNGDGHAGKTPPGPEVKVKFRWGFLDCQSHLSPLWLLHCATDDSLVFFLFFSLQVNDAEASSI